MTDLPTFVPLVVLVFLFAGLIKGTIGIGLPTISVGLMSQFLPPHTAIAIVVFPIVASNFWQVVREGFVLSTVRKYLWLIAPLALTLWVTTFFTSQTSPEFLLGAIGVSIVVFALTNLIGRPPELPTQFDRPAQIATGISAGILGGLTSIWAPPIVTYLVARRTPSDEFVRAVGVFIFAGSLPLAIGFWQSGLLTGPLAQLSMAMMIPAIIGFTVGEKLRRKMSADTFRLVLLWMFLLMGLNLLRRAIFG